MNIRFCIICRFFVKGGCKVEDYCKLLHVPTNEVYRCHVEKRILLEEFLRDVDDLTNKALEIEKKYGYVSMTKKTDNAIMLIEQGRDTFFDAITIKDEVKIMAESLTKPAKERIRDLIEDLE